MATWGPLALVGGDELNPGNEPQDEVLVRAAGDGPAFVLATAAGRQHPEAAVANAVRWFAGLGLRVEELPATRRSDAKDAANVARAREGRFFYLVGGDPGLVPKVLAGTPLWDAIVEAWAGGPRSPARRPARWRSASGRWSANGCPATTAAGTCPRSSSCRGSRCCRTSRRSGIAGWTARSAPRRGATSSCSASTSARRAASRRRVARVRRRWGHGDRRRRAPAVRVGRDDRRPPDTRSGARSRIERGVTSPTRAESMGPGRPRLELLPRAGDPAAQGARARARRAARVPGRRRLDPGDLATARRRSSGHRGGRGEPARPARDPRHPSGPVPAGRRVAPVLDGADEPAAAGRRPLRPHGFVGRRRPPRRRSPKATSSRVGRRRDRVHARVPPRRSRSRGRPGTSTSPRTRRSKASSSRRVRTRGGPRSCATRRATSSRARSRSSATGWSTPGRRRTRGRRADDRVLREDLLERIPRGVPTMLDYRTYAETARCTTRRRCSRSTC